MCTNFSDNEIGYWRTAVLIVRATVLIRPGQELCGALPQLAKVLICGKLVGDQGSIWYVLSPCHPFVFP